jgi:SAM-dependent methyltransferase
MADAIASASLAGPLRACAQGRTPPNVALMQLLAATPDEATARRALHAAEAAPADAHALRRIREIRQRWDQEPNAFQLVKKVTSVTARPEGADWAAAFDEAARMSPVAAVALYSLGNLQLLAAATEELVAQLHAWDLLHAGFCVLDLGCGFGRVADAIAKEVRLVVALEISTRMAELARTTLGRHRNVVVIRSAGDGLSFLPDARFDVVLAIDSFPYLVDRGLGERHLADAARVLQAGGALLIMNYSYRGDLALDRRDLGHFAAAYGFAVERNGTTGLSLWDGRAFLLRRL